MHLLENTAMYYIDAVDISSQKRENLTELLFETYSCSKLILGYRPLLASLYYTSTFTNDSDITAVVIDIAKSTKITPIVYLLNLML